MTKAEYEESMFKRTRCINALDRFISQRSGIEFGNYGSRADAMIDYRRILRDGRDARAMLRAVENCRNLPCDILIGAMRWRLSYDDAKRRINYCAGQYWAIEYRKAACLALAQALYDYWVSHVGHDNGVSRRQIAYDEAKRSLGRGIAKRWFAP